MSATAPRRRAAQRAVRASASPLVLDSSCWIEYFADTERADLFAVAIESVEMLIVPVVTVYEVFKKLHREAGEDVATEALALMQRAASSPSTRPSRWPRRRTACRWPTA